MTVCQNPCPRYNLSCKPKTRLLLLLSPVFTQFSAERTSQRLLPSQSFAEPDCSSTVGGGRLENTPVRTSDPGGSQLAVGMRKAVLDLTVSQFTSLPTSPNLLFETVAKRLQCRGVGGRATSLCVCSRPPTYHAPVHPMPSSPFICRGEKD